MLMAGVGCAETYQGVNNPCTEIGCLKYLLTKLLSFEIDDARRGKWSKLLEEMPGVPLRRIRGMDLLAVGEPTIPAAKTAKVRNCIRSIPSARCGSDNRNCSPTPASRSTCGTSASTAPTTNRRWKRAAGSPRRCRRLISACPRSRPPGQHQLQRPVHPLDRQRRSRRAVSAAAPRPLPGVLGMQDGWHARQRPRRELGQHPPEHVAAIRRQKIFLLPAWPEDWDVSFKLMRPSTPPSSAFIGTAECSR